MLISDRRLTCNKIASKLVLLESMHTITLDRLGMRKMAAVWVLRYLTSE